MPFHSQSVSIVQGQKRLESITPKKWSHEKPWVLPNLALNRPISYKNLDIHFMCGANVCNYRSKLFKSGLVEVEKFPIVMTGQITDFRLPALKDKCTFVQLSFMAY